MTPLNDLSSTWRKPSSGYGTDSSVRKRVGAPAAPSISSAQASDCDTRATTPELINFDEPSETRRFEKGRFDVYRVGPATLGRATYEPGWRWSEHVGPTVGTASCQVEHVGLVLSGQAVVKMDDGTERLMKAGDFFYVPPGHDSWVVGDEPYVSLHILGSEEYAAPAE